jgi:hypothetical protein
MVKIDQYLRPLAVASWGEGFVVVTASSSAGHPATLCGVVGVMLWRRDLVLVSRHPVTLRGIVEGRLRCRHIVLVGQHPATLCGVAKGGESCAYYLVEESEGVMTLRILLFFT